MVSVLPSSAVDCGLESPSGKTIDYEIGICCFSAMHAALRRKNKDWLAGALRRKNKDWLARNQNNVFECSDMSTR